MRRPTERSLGSFEMGWHNELNDRCVPLCMSIDTTPIGRKRTVRKRHMPERKALSLAAVHEPPDKPEVENGRRVKETSRKDCSNKRSAFPFGAHKKRPKDKRR